MVDFYRLEVSPVDTRVHAVLKWVPHLGLLQKGIPRCKIIVSYLIQKNDFKPVVFHVHHIKVGKNFYPAVQTFAIFIHGGPFDQEKSLLFKQFNLYM